MSFDALAPPKEKAADIVPSNGIERLSNEPPTIITVIQEAIRRNVDINTITKLFEMRERELAREAKQAFDIAFALFQKEAPKLEKLKAVSFGPNKTAYKFSPLDYVEEKLTPVLSKNGLSYSWKQEQEKGSEDITVTCV